MKKIVSNIKTAIIALSLMALMSGLNASSLELRFSEAAFNADAKELYVDIQVRNAHQGQIALAGQNYRFYYNSEVLSLDASASKSKLSEKNYSEPKFENHFENISADQVNQLSFDKDLGFANFAIDLTNNIEGGIRIGNDTWTTVATLTFTVKNTNKNYDLVWGREGITDLYATAFVEIGEWTGENLIDKVDIEFYGDLSSEIETQTIERVLPNIQIGPNPTTDVVRISYDKEIREQKRVIIRDYTGKKLIESSIDNGSLAKRIDVAHLMASTYILEIISKDGSLEHRTQLIVAK